MQKLFLFLLLLIASLSVSAVIYKSVDSEGNVIYSDESSLNAEEIADPSPNTVIMPKPRPEAAPVQEAPETSYTRLRVVSPAANETLRSNPGIVEITLELEPALDTEAGHGINILMDGYVLVKNSSQLKLQIPDISRGTHNVQALVTSKKGKTLISSPKVQFFMQRQSVLNKPGARRVGPLDSAGRLIHPGPQGT